MLSNLARRSLRRAALVRPISSRTAIELEDRYGATNYHPLPVVLSRASGVWAWDPEDNRYLDFLSAYSAVNQGHCHPRLLSALTKQAEKLTLTSRAFYNDQLGQYEKYITELLGYDRVLPMNTGVEGGETAVKLARRWGYDVKGVPANQATVLFMHGNFWGRTLAAVSTSDDPDSYSGYGPLVPGFRKVPYNNLPALQAALEADPNIVGVMLEPIQGEAGVVVPDDGFLKGVKALCQKHNALMIADEVQTGLARTGRMLACDYEQVKPDILVLGKALSGGILPVSAVLARDEIILTIKPGQHGSTYGGNPLACAVATEALKVLVDEGMAENAFERGQQLRRGLAALSAEFPHMLAGTRGKGLLSALLVRPDARDAAGKSVSAWELCLGMRSAAKLYGAPHGMLAKPTQKHVIRLAPPLCISAQEVDGSLDVMRRTLAGISAGVRPSELPF